MGVGGFNIVSVLFFCFFLFLIEILGIFSGLRQYQTEMIFFFFKAVLLWSDYRPFSQFFLRRMAKYAPPPQKNKIMIDCHRHF